MITPKIQSNHNPFRHRTVSSTTITRYWALGTSDDPGGGEVKSRMTTSRSLLVCVLCCCFLALEAFSIRDLIKGAKRTGAINEPMPCPTWHPFQCPNGDCVPIKYLCDGSADCGDGFDENPQMCTAATRPPVEETASFLKALIQAHGDDFFVKLFGPKAKSKLSGMGGVDQVAVALSQSPTAEAFGSEMKLTEDELMKMMSVMDAITSGAGGSTDLSANESADFRFFAQKLRETGFF
uniref:Prohormone-4 n=1 Tax=Panagrellus redivivus TaxID=6233 RepID=A0A7E4V533_PANRE